MRWRRCRSARDFELWADAHREILPGDDLPGEHHARWLLADGAEVAAIGCAGCAAAARRALRCARDPYPARFR